MYVIVCGGGDVGYYLTKALYQQGYEVLLLEKDHRRATSLSEELGDIVMYGDACEVRVLNEAGVRRADVVVAATGDDEDNLIICQLAKNFFGVKRILSRLRDPRHEPLFRKLGVRETISTTRLIFNLLEQEVETGEVLPIGALHRGQIEVVEAEVTLHSPVAGKEVGMLDLPKQCVVVSVIREGNPYLAVPELVLQPGDTVIALAPMEAERNLAKVFTG